MTKKYGYPLPNTLPCPNPLVVYFTLEIVSLPSPAAKATTKATASIAISRRTGRLRCYGRWV